MELKDYDRYVVRQKVKGDDALLYSKGIDYFVEPSDTDFEPLLARDISEKDEDFILKGKVYNKMFFATDVIYHGEFFANKPWNERYLELKKEFNYTPSIRMNGAIVVDSVQEILDAAEAYSYAPYFDGAYVEGYSSDMYEDRILVGDL